MAVSVVQRLRQRWCLVRHRVARTDRRRNRRTAPRSDGRSAAIEKLTSRTMTGTITVTIDAGDLMGQLDLTERRAELTGAARSQRGGSSGFRSAGSC